MGLTENERRVLAKLAQDLRNTFGAQEIRLFGSATKNDLAEESDIDIFVVVSELNWPIEQAISDRCYEATLECGRLITPCVFSRHELTDTPLRASPLVKSVKQEGISL